ncbi:MAG: transcription elongation factor GreA [Gammaproteobacteria bacterium TMED95]|nr:transcription elongation factor GreA [Gammaproteobacteria bacterium]OUV20317.1 MAG: transcription elongation factor GreA [Gammaproteobacteria bacterium TMED95]|tara:strand:+ start:214 stop:690 length:477 start_codon:yes stop_codon:yes gene_type:complete
MDKIPMTETGAEALRVELKRLTSIERPRIVKEISAALEQGDLRENAEFQYAKEEQGHIEGRISEIAAKLGAAQIIDVTEIPNNGKVIFGVTVTLLNLDTDETVVYKIVGDDESDIKENKISIYSPVARSLIGKQVDDSVLIQIPSGQIEYEILSVEHL